MGPPRRPPGLATLYAELPRLAGSVHQITSDPVDRYNCVAWVLGELNAWVQPEFDWPTDVPKPTGIEDLHCYIALFERDGWEVTDSEALEPGYLKLALYVTGDEFHHVALQLRDGDWTSKVGLGHDLRHRELDALYDCVNHYGARATLFMRRPDDGREMELYETGLILLH